jgi:major membrane immunogen (membrane-anchored lipoprotein)
MKKIYIIALIFVCMFLVGCKSSDNERGITFRVNDGYFQWQYEGDTTWTNIISLEELNGQDGTHSFYWRKW